MPTGQALSLDLRHVSGQQLGIATDFQSISTTPFNNNSFNSARQLRQAFTMRSSRISPASSLGQLVFAPMNASPTKQQPKSLVPTERRESSKQLQLNLALPRRPFSKGPDVPGVPFLCCENPSQGTAKKEYTWLISNIVVFHPIGFHRIGRVWTTVLTTVLLGLLPTGELNYAIARPSMYFAAGVF
ncbi:predicted protein [Histoplasma capsulatum var. duboisii H88]|uniref:Predicted protein n=1 Tax=Ajellomyces capsulatus (strain H88) TaxID=544711 RepID=F0UCQ5_AJEC8|nr:predicted protein [Histoplasma capsulatum var. duboisii H88]